MIQHETELFCWKRHISFLLALLCAGAWAVFSPRTAIGASNVAAYLLGLVLFVAVFWAAQIILPEQWFCQNNNQIPTKAYHGIWWGTFLLFCGMVVYAFAQSSVISGGQAAMEWGLNRYFIAAFIVAVLGVAGCISCKQYKNVSFSHQALRLIWYAAIAALLLFTVWWAYVPNVLNYTWDFEAYWFSAFATARGIPVSVDTTSYYGHYGMLMAPFFRLLGGFTPMRVAFLVCAESVLMTACVCYVLHTITKSYLWRFLGLFAVLDYYATLSTVEPQMTPHRVLFPVLLLAFATFYLQGREKRGKFFSAGGIAAGYLLAVLGLVWCTDSGIVGIAAWCALHFYVCFSARKLSWKDGLHLLRIAASGVLCLLLAWQGTSWANQLFWKGEALDFQTFVMPFSAADFSVGTQKTAPVQVEPAVSVANADSDAKKAEQTAAPAAPVPGKDAGYIGSLQLSLVRTWTPWGLAVLLFVCYIAKGLLGTSLFSKAPCFAWKKGLGFFAAILGALMLIYFFNRVYYYNMFTVHFLIVVLLVLLGQDLRADSSGRKKNVPTAIYRAISTGALLCLVVMGCFAAGRLPIQIAKIRDCQNTAVMSMFFQELSERMQGLGPVRVIGPSATYCNAALSLENDAIMWRPWVNEILLPQYPEDTTLLLTEEGYWQIRQNRAGDDSLIDKKRFQLENNFILNYNNRGYEESKTFYVYRPNGVPK